MVHTLETKEWKWTDWKEEKVKFQFYISLLYLYLKCVNWRQNKYKSATDDWLIIDWLVLEIDFLLYFYFFLWLCILCIFVCISVFVFVFLFKIIFFCICICIHSYNYVFLYLYLFWVNVSIEANKRAMQGSDWQLSDGSKSAIFLPRPLYRSIDGLPLLKISKILKSKL